VAFFAGRSLRSALGLPQGKGFDRDKPTMCGLRIVGLPRGKDFSALNARPSSREGLAVPSARKGLFEVGRSPTMWGLPVLGLPQGKGFDRDKPTMCGLRIVGLPRGKDFSALSARPSSREGLFDVGRSPTMWGLPVIGLPLGKGLLTQHFVPSPPSRGGLAPD
jgi:hypothetical protein